MALAKKVSFCKEGGELLPSGLPITRKLRQGDCVTSSAFKKPEFPIIPQFDKFPKPPLLSTSLQPPHPNDITHFRQDVDQPRLSSFVTDKPPIKHDIIIEKGELGAQYSLSGDVGLKSLPKPLLVPIEPKVTIVNLPKKPPPNYHAKKPVNNWNNFHIDGANHHTNYRPPIQPMHLAGPPGAWNIVTSKPGSLPPPIHVYNSKYSTPSPPSPYNKNGVEIKYGPKFPLAPLSQKQQVNHFPSRRRPSTSVKHPQVFSPHLHKHQLTDMRFGESATAVTVHIDLNDRHTSEMPPATERIDGINENDIIIVDDIGQLENITITSNNKSSAIKTDILSDDKLTIFKVGPDNDIERVVNMSSFDENNIDSEQNTDFKFVILHKLPNGDAVDLENLKTYNYDDLINGYANDFSFNSDDYDSDVFDRENYEYMDVPRKYADENVKAFVKIGKKPQVHSRPNGINPVYKPQTSSVAPSTTQKKYNKVSTTHKSPIYNPTSQTPMLSSQLQNKNISHEDMIFLQSKVEQMLSSDNRKSILNQDEMALKDKYIIDNIDDKSQFLDIDQLDSPRRSLTIPKSTQENERELVSNLSQLSQLASLSISDKGLLANSLKNDLQYKPLGPGQDNKLTIQLLPPRLSAVLTHITPDGGKVEQQKVNQNIARGHHIKSQRGHGSGRAINHHGPGAHRQNKIAPAFKSRNYNRHNYARRFSSGDFIVTHPYQTQVIPREDKTRFIPLAPKQPPKQLWWHPSNPQKTKAHRNHGHPVFVPQSHNKYNRKVPVLSKNSDINPMKSNNLVRNKNYPQPERAVQIQANMNSKFTTSHNNVNLLQIDKHVIKESYPREIHLTTQRTDILKEKNFNVNENRAIKNSLGKIEMLEQIATLERKATHIQQPFLPRKNLDSKESLHNDKQSDSIAISPASGGISTQSSTLLIKNDEIFIENKTGTQSTLSENDAYVPDNYQEVELSFIPQNKSLLSKVLDKAEGNETSKVHKNPTKNVAHTHNDLVENNVKEQEMFIAGNQHKNVSTLSTASNFTIDSLELLNATLTDQVWYEVYTLPSQHTSEDQTVENETLRSLTEK